MLLNIKAFLSKCDPSYRHLPDKLKIYVPCLENYNLKIEPPLCLVFIDFIKTKFYAFQMWIIGLCMPFYALQTKNLLGWTWKVETWFLWKE